MENTDKKTPKTGPIVYTKQIAAELGKTRWPKKDDLLTSATATVVFTAIAVGLLTVADMGLGKFAQLLFS